MLRPKEVVSKWIDVFNAGDVDAITNLYHDNAINHQVANDSVVGIDAIREMFINESKLQKWSVLLKISLKMDSGPFWNGKTH